MGNKLKEWVKHRFMTCKLVTRLAFDSEGQSRLSFADNLKFKFHLSTCVWCRRYYKQSKLLSEALNVHQHELPEESFSEKKMSDDAKSKIKQALRDAAR